MKMKKTAQKTPEQPLLVFSVVDRVPMPDVGWHLKERNWRHLPAAA